MVNRSPKTLRQAEAQRAPLQRHALLSEAGSERWVEIEFEESCALFSAVSVGDVIQEIQLLTPSEQAEVIQFAYRLDAERMSSGKELGALAKRMIDASDPVEKLKIREEMTRGFYGAEPNA